MDRALIVDAGWSVSAYRGGNEARGDTARRRGDAGPAVTYLAGDESKSALVVPEKAWPRGSTQDLSLKMLVALSSGLVLQHRPEFLGRFASAHAGGGAIRIPGDELAWNRHRSRALPERTVLVTGPHCVSHSCPTAPQGLWGASGTVRRRLVLDFGI